MISFVIGSNSSLNSETETLASAPSGPLSNSRSNPYDNMNVTSRASSDGNCELYSEESRADPRGKFEVPGNKITFTYMVIGVTAALYFHSISQLTN